jgi:hypothetical protein
MDASLMPKYRKRPIDLEAFKLSADGFPDLMHVPPELFPRWFVAAAFERSVIMHPERVDISTLEGVMRADLGDYVIQGVHGEIYPCKPEIFTQLYDELIDAAAPGAASHQE